MWCSTASTTTMASSTTKPMASTRPKRDSVLIEKPSSGNSVNVPTSDTGTASRRDQRGAPALQKDIDDDDHEDQRFEEGVHDLLDALPHRERRIERRRRSRGRPEIAL